MIRDEQITTAFFLLCLLIQAQERRIRKLEEFYTKLARENDRLSGRQVKHLRRVK